MYRRNNIILIFILLFLSCDMIEYHPYDGRISGETGINTKNIIRIEKACEKKKSIRFVATGDTQGYYNETEAFVKSINARNDIDFVIHGGDITDYGMTWEFTKMRNTMNKLTVPYVVLLGNHDCLGTGIDVFHTIFGEVDFSFMAGNIKFVCLNTNALEFDYSHPVPDFGFIKQELTDELNIMEKTVITMHIPPLTDSFNNNVADEFQDYIKQFPNLQFCLHAHHHQFEENDIFNDGVIYYGIPNPEKGQYLVFTINEDNTYDYEIVNF